MLTPDGCFNNETLDCSFVAREDLNHLFNLSVDLLCIISVDGYFKSLNPSWEHTLGFPREKLCSEPYIRFVHADDQQKTLDAMHKLSIGENVLNFENRYNCIDGTYKWLMWNTIVDNDLVYGVARDITKQREMENELRESEERYRRLVELSPDTVVVHTDEKITYLNETGLKLIGASSLQEVAGRSIMEFIDPSSKAPAIKRKQRIEKEGKLTDPGEYKIRRLDGSKIEMELQSTSITYEGKSAVLAVMRDISSRKKMEKELWETQERYRIITENVSDIISIYNKEGTLKYTSPSRAMVLGGLPETGKERQLFSGMHPDDRSRVEEAYIQTISTKLPIRQEFRYRHVKDQWITMETIGIPVIEENGEVEDVVLVSRDTTERKRIEEELRESENKYRLIAENMSDLIGVLDVNGTIQYASPSHQKVLGYFPEGKSVLDLIHPEDLPFVQSLFNEMIVSKSPRLVELRYQHADGHFIVIEANGMPVIGAGGKVQKVVMVARDITKRWQAEEALQESEKQLRTLTNALPDCVFLKDGENRWLEANNAGIRLFHLDGVPYKGKTDSDLANYSKISRDSFLNCQLGDEEAWKAGEITQSEEVIPQPDGNPKVFDVIKVPAFYPDGKRKGMVVIGRDITERKKAEEIMRKTDKLAVVGELAAGIAHEIRNPLTSLIGFTKLLQSTSVEHGHYFEIMLAELDRINLIVSEFLLLAKPHILSFEMKNLSTILYNVVSILESEANKNNIQIIIVIAPDIPLIKCEENQMKQVIINILKNAIEAMPNGGHIFVKAKMDHSHNVLVQFIDEGCGISEERIPKLGEPFYTTKEKGTGLGLTVSYKIVQNHHGKMRIRSQRDKGTTVEISLPVST